MARISKIARLGLSALVLVAVSAAQASALDVDAKKIQVKDNADPVKRQIQVMSNDVDILYTAADDPATNGASIIVYSATDSQCIILEGGLEWTTNGKQWKYKNKLTKEQAQIGDKKLIVKIKSGVTYTLADDGTQGTVNAQVQFGDAGTRFCLRCSAPDVVKDDVKQFHGKQCVATPCDAEPLVCDPSTTTTTAPTTTLPPGFYGALPPSFGRFNYGLGIGVPGANARCNMEFAGSHACSVSELLTAETNGDLLGLMDVDGGTVTSFWGIDSTRPDDDQCTVTTAWDYQTVHTGQFGDRMTLTNGTGDLGPITTGNNCGTTSWVGCCI